VCSRGCLLVAWAWHFSKDLSAVAVAAGCKAASVVILLRVAGPAYAAATTMVKRPTIAIRADQTGCRRGQRRFAADRECRGKAASVVILLAVAVAVAVAGVRRGNDDG
jgi:hypothetical protein